MARFRSWAYGNETIAFMASDMGFAFSFAGSMSISTTARTWAGGPTRYSLTSNTGARTVTYPAYMISGDSGVVVTTYRQDTASFAGNYEILNVLAADTARIHVESNSGGQTYDLYAVGVLKGTSGAVVLTDWHTIALAYEVDVNPWSARLEIDGVVEVATATQARPATTVASYGTEFNVDGYVDELRSFTNFSDSPPIRFTTRAPATADGTDVGTWTPDTGVDDFARIAPPVAAASYTENAATSVGHYLETDINGAGGTDDISDTLGGMTPGVIDGVDLFIYATGTSSSLDARVSDDGITFVDGVDEVLSGTTSVATVGTNVRPSDSNPYVGADQLTYRGQITA